MTMRTDHSGSQSKPQKGSLRDFFYVLFGHKGKIAMVVLLLLGAVVAVTLLKPGVYRSEARLLVRLGRETVSLGPTATIGEIAQITRTYDWEINSELEILKSREIAERVVDKMGPAVFLERPPRTPLDVNEATAAVRFTAETLEAARKAISAALKTPRRLAVQLGLSEPTSEREQAIEVLSDSIKIESRPNTSVISLSYKEQTPELARSILEEFIQAYLDKHLVVYSSTNSQQFFEDQVADLQSKLRGTELELQGLKDSTGVSSLEEQRLATVTKIGTLELDIAKTEGELAFANARIAAIQKMLAQIPESIVLDEITGFSDYAADLMRNKLYELKLLEKDLEVKYPNGNRQLDMVREQVREGEAMLEREKSQPNRIETKKGLNEAHKLMQSELLQEQSSVSAMQGKLDIMRKQVADARESLKLLNDVELKTARLQREITLLTGSYGRYFDKLEEARIEESLKGERISNISVLQAATLPAEPAGPGKAVRLGLGLVFALLGGIGFAFLCEFLDHTIKTPEDVYERLQLTTLASIPRTRLNTVHPEVKSHRHRTLEGKDIKTASPYWDIPANVRRHYVAFRERLLLAANGASHDHYVIGVTSCSHSEGVSTVAANLASSLSQMGNGGVLLVDANSHDPAIHRIFQTRLSPGLLDVLTTTPGDGDDPVIHHAANLSILTAGNANGSGVKLGASERLPHFLRTSTSDYRFVVIDMPALDDEGSTLRWVSACDGVVLVVETERLRWEAIAKARQQLQQWHVNVLGVLLNKRRFPVPNWIYAAL